METLAAAAHAARAAVAFDTEIRVKPGCECGSNDQFDFSMNFSLVEDLARGGAAACPVERM